MISLLTPTRHRPDRFSVMVNSVIGTVKGAVEIVAYVADEDNTYDAMIPAPVVLADGSDEKDVWQIFEGGFGGKVTVRFVRGPRFPEGGTFSDLWNAIVPFAKGDVFMQNADDVFFRTPGWDLEVEAAFAHCPDRILCVYADDLGPSGKVFATLPFVSRRWVEVVGYFTGPGFAADFSDAWPNDVAEMIGRRVFLPGVEIEHLHWMWKKAAKDATYVENEKRYREQGSNHLYVRREPERVADAAKLRQAIADFAVKNHALHNAMMGEM